jgi:hypothetical protein
VSERSPSADPSYKPDPVTAWMAVAGSGLIPRKATLELPRLPANRATRRLPRSRTRAAIPRSERASLLPIVADALTLWHPECDRRAGPGGVIAFVALQQRRSWCAGDRFHQTRRVALAETPQAADPPLAREQGCR